LQALNGRAPHSAPFPIFRVGGISPRGPVSGPVCVPLNLDFSDLFETDGDRITRHRINYDQVQFMSQLGLMQYWRQAMFTIQQTVTIDRPVDQVFAFLAEPDNIPRW